ncbi:DUF1003 domain-containing protein [Brevundimonas faecalis]|uniref:Membrane protein n=1 Tax=Brevundimonas faecalis TaxID=947378 RepID=A0ABV2RB22_9CAUL
MSHAHDPEHLSRRWFGKSSRELAEAERRVIERASARQPVSRDVNAGISTASTFGERLADRVASFGGSWAFISLFALSLLAWTGLNLALRKEAFDPYPFIFLNLVLSMLAAVQAPIIMMSQNRQAARDRLDAANDYEVNLKAEIEIMALHEKLDEMRDRQMQDLILRQQEQIEILTQLVKRQADERPA